MMDFASLSVVTPGVIPNKQGAAQVVSKKFEVLFLDKNICWLID